MGDEKQFDDDTHTPAARRLAGELRGATKLVVDATQQLSHVVQEMHEQIGGGPALLGRPLMPFIRLFSGPVYASIRAVADVVGVGLDALLAELAPAFDGAVPPTQYDFARAALCGVLGDHLAATKNPLAIEMTLRARGKDLELTREGLADALPDATGRVLVLLHGSSMDDAFFMRDGHHHGEFLAREHGFTIVTVRYNSGLHVSENGRALDPLLEALVEQWNVDIDALVLLGFSMGGLVARSAVHVAEETQRRWRDALSAMLFLGTPHHGAPLERVGNVVDALLDVSRYSAPLRKLAAVRSAGITDLRYGLVVDEHWRGKDRLALDRDPRSVCALPEGVRCFVIAGSMSTARNDSSTTGAAATEHGLAGDGLVEVDSALGRHANAALDMRVPSARQHVVLGVRHNDLLGNEEAARVMSGWMGEVLATRVDAGA